MRLDQLEQLLAQTLEDHKLSRAEKRVLADVFAGLDLSPESRAAYLNRAFALAKDEVSTREDRRIIDWLLETSKVLARSGRSTEAETSEVLFTPEDDIPSRLRSLIDRTSKSLWLCVFTVTDDSLSGPIEAAHRRGVDVRLVTDDDKARDRGSDAWRLVESGVPVRADRLPDHMHHKFAVFDGRTLVTGSYNWTRGAARRNHENLLITDDARLVEPYVAEFLRLWEQFEPMGG